MLIQKEMGNHRKNIKAIDNKIGSFPISNIMRLDIAYTEILMELFGESERTHERTSTRPRNPKIPTFYVTIVIHSFFL